MIEVMFDAPEDLMPTRAHEGDAGFDLRAYGTNYVRFGDVTIVDTKTRVELPPDHVGLVCSRSGLAYRDGIFVVNAPGVIDQGYEGTIQVILSSVLRDKPAHRIGHGERIAQLLVLPTSVFVNVAPELASSRGENGLGSTGI